MTDQREREIEVDEVAQKAYLKGLAAGRSEMARLVREAEEQVAELLEALEATEKERDDLGAYIDHHMRAEHATASHEQLFPHRSAKHKERA